jgi:nucleotide-binding universal stress UspA family protein
MLKGVADGLNGLKVELYARSGPPAAVLVRHAEEVGADLIVVGSKGMQGARRLIGSVPNTVAHNATCHVLIAKTS